MDKKDKLLLELKKINHKVLYHENIEYLELQNPFEFFKWCVNNGFLLHGSPKLFKTIEPRKANDTYRELGSLNAIYMSIHPETSMVKTILGDTNSGYSFKRDKLGNIIEYEIFTEDLSKLNQEGFMYIIDNANSQEIVDGDHVSYKSINPVAIVKFNKTDFKYPISES